MRRHTKNWFPKIWDAYVAGTWPPKYGKVDSGSDFTGFSVPNTLQLFGVFSFMRPAFLSLISLHVQTFGPTWLFAVPIPLLVTLSDLRDANTSSLTTFRFLSSVSDCHHREALDVLVLSAAIHLKKKRPSPIIIFHSTIQSSVIHDQIKVQWWSVIRSDRFHFKQCSISRPRNSSLSSKMLLFK